MCDTCGCSHGDGLSIRKPGEQNSQEHHHEHIHQHEHEHDHDGTTNSRNTDFGKMHFLRK